MSDNLLDRLRQNRKRANVQEREDTLVPLEVPSDSSSPNSPSPPGSIKELQQRLTQFPKTRRHSAIVLEEETDRKLTQYCKEQGITVETFLEAAWQVSSEHPVLLRKVFKEAKRRYDARKEAGKIRRLITMLSKKQS